MSSASRFETSRRPPAPARCSDSDPIAILEDLAAYLRSTNVAPTNCRETSMAITRIEEAMHWLKARAEKLAERRRQARR